MSTVSVLNSILLIGVIIGVIIVRLWVFNNSAKSHAVKAGC